jgi:hypothetical protein
LGGARSGKLRLVTLPRNKILTSGVHPGTVLEMMICDDDDYRPPFSIRRLAVKTIGRAFRWLGLEGPCGAQGATGICLCRCPGEQAIRRMVNEALNQQRDDAPVIKPCDNPECLCHKLNSANPPPMWVPQYANPTEAIKAQMAARQQEIERTRAEIIRLQVEQHIREQNHIDAEHTKVGESVRPIAQSPCGSTVKGHVCGLPDTYNPH